jgi:hypothetical protein
MTEEASTHEAGEKVEDLEASADKQRDVTGGATAIEYSTIPTTSDVRPPPPPRPAR